MKIKKIYDQNVSFRLSIIVLIILLIALIVCGYKFTNGSLDDRYTALYGGLVTSLIAVVIQFLMSWNEHREIENYKKMGLLKVLPNRDNKTDYYYKLISNATKRIDFLGKTACSFLRDFGNIDKNSGEKSSALVRAMEKGVQIRVMIYDNTLLENKKEKFDEAKKKLDELKTKYPKNFDYIYLTNISSYTLVTADDECIVGSIISDINSDITSAIHAYTNSPYLKCYLDYFNGKWDFGKDNCSNKT